MESITDDGPPPPPLTLAFFCGEYHLPGTGGVLDQNYAELKQMKSAYNIYRTVTKFRSLHGDAVNTELTINERLLLGEIQKMGLLKVGLKR